MSNTPSISLFARMAKMGLLAVQLVFGVFIGLGLVRAHAAFRQVESDSTAVALAVMWLLPALAFWLGIFMHEAGHWLGSRWAKLHLLAMSVVWMHLERQGPRWRFRLGKRRPGALGHVLAVPLDFHRLRQRMATFIAAGPVANMVTGFPALALGWWWVQPVVARTVTVGIGQIIIIESVFYFGLFSVFLGLVNLLPYTGSLGNTSDGQKLRQYARQEPESERQLTLLKMSGLSHQGIRPRLWDPAWLVQLLDVPANTASYCHAHVCAYTYHLDKGEIATARQHLERAYEAREATQPLFRRQLYGQAAYMELIHSEDVSQAPQWLAAAENVKPFTEKEGLFMRTIVACSAGEWATARQLLRRMKQELEKLNDVGNRLQSLDYLHELENYIQKHESAG